MDASEFWMRRFEHYDNQARTLFLRTVELISIALTVLAGVIGVAISYRVYGVLALVAPFVVLIWVVAARLIHEQLLLFAYRDQAEQHAAIFAGAMETPLSTWQAEGGRRARRGFVNIATFAVLAAVSVVVMAGSLIYVGILEVLPAWLFWADVVGCAVGLMMGALAFRRALADHESVAALAS